MPIPTPHLASLYGIIMYLVIRRKDVKEKSERTDKRDDKTPVDRK